MALGKEPSSSVQKPPSLWGLLGALASAVAVWFFSKSHTPSEHSDESHCPQDSTGDATYIRQNPSSGPLRIAIDSVPPPSPPTDEEKTEKEREKKNTRLKNRLEIGAILIAFGLLGINILLWRSTQKAANAAKESADTAQKQLELSERPWIKIVDVKTHGDNPIIPALSFQKIGPYKDVSQQATFQLIISLKNIGHSVADIAVSYELFFPVWDSGGYWNVISSEQKRFCDSPAGKVPQFYPKFVVFPGEPFDWHGAATGLINPSVMNHLPGQGETGYILPVIIVCTNYRLRPLEKSYQTRTIYEAFHVEDRTRFFKIGEGVPAKRILVIRNELADDAY